MPEQHTAIHVTTFVCVQSIEKAHEFGSIGTQYVVDISGLVLVGHKELQNGRIYIEN